MKITKTIVVLIMLCNTVLSQNILFSKSGSIRFFSKTPLENIEAVNKEVTTFMNTEKGEIVFSVLIKSFRFEKALMEEHFNENYMESDKFPKASFKGNIENQKNVNWEKDGTYPIMINGELTIHGVSKKISISATINIIEGKVTGTANFKVKTADYNIKIPALVKGKIAESIDVDVKSNYEVYKK